MKKGNQHIAFDELLALYHQKLSLREVHQYKKHLGECEACQDLLDGIEAFNTAPLVQPQHPENQLEKQLLKINQQYTRKRIFKYFVFMVGCIFFILFFGLTLKPLKKIDDHIQPKSKAIWQTNVTPKSHPRNENEGFICQQNSENNLAEKRNQRTNIHEAKPIFIEKQTPVLSDLLEGLTESKPLIESEISTVKIELLAENIPLKSKIKGERSEVSLYDKMLTTSSLRQIKTIAIPSNLKPDLAPIQMVRVAHDEQQIIEDSPVTPKFYAQYGLSYMANIATPSDEIPLTQRIQSDTLIGSKISEHLVDAYSDLVGLDLAFGHQFNRHLGVELGASYVYSRENLIDEEITNRNYDRLYISNTRFTLSPAVTLETSRAKWRPFARFGLLIPIEGETKRRQISNEAELVHSFISFINLDANVKSANANFESNSIIKWRSSVGYNLTLGARYQVNDAFSVFGSIAYAGLHVKGKNYEMYNADIVTNQGVRTNILPIANVLKINTHKTYVNEKVNFSTINLSIGARFHFE